MPQVKNYSVNRNRYLVFDVHSFQQPEQFASVNERVGRLYLVCVFIHVLIIIEKCFHKCIQTLKKTLYVMFVLA